MKNNTLSFNEVEIDFILKDRIDSRLQAIIDDKLFYLLSDVLDELKLIGVDASKYIKPMSNLS